MKRLYRDRFDKKISGVCGGLAQFFQLDASMIRLLFILLSIVTGGIFVLIYLLLWMILPLGPRAYVAASYKKLYRTRNDRKIAGVCGGFGKYFKIDPNIIRLIVVVAFFMTAFFPILIAYVICVFVIPEEFQERRSY